MRAEDRFTSKAGKAGERHLQFTNYKLQFVIKERVMGQLKIMVCDRCKAEQREDEKAHWTCQFGTGAICSFKNVPGVQKEYKHDVLCPTCALQIDEVVASIWYKKEEKV